LLLARTSVEAKISQLLFVAQKHNIVATWFDMHDKVEALFPESRQGA
jgi:hypothetical protein